MIENALWKIAALLLTVVLLFVVPLTSLFQRQSDLTYETLVVETTALCDQVRDTGYLTMDQYLDYTRKLAHTGEQYKIQLTYMEKTYVPVLDNLGQPTGTAETVYSGTYTETILEQLSTTGRLSMNVGDFFYVETEATSKTKDAVMKSLLLGQTQEYPWLYTRNGGMIHHEND